MRIDNIATTATDIGLVPSASLAQSSVSPVGLNWNSHMGNPTSLGGGITGGSSTTNPAAYVSAPLGVRVAQKGVGFASGSVFFHLTGSNAFNFARDFRVTTTVQYSGSVGTTLDADAYFIEFGATGSVGNNVMAAQDGNISLKAQLYTGGSGSIVYVNGTGVLQDSTAFSSNFINELSRDWHTSTAEVITDKVSGKRTLNWFINNTWLFGGADVSTWNPSTTGGIVKIGGMTGGATVTLYCKSIKVEYL